MLGSTGTELFVARYVADGSALDSTFGGTGVVKTRLTTSTTDSEILRDLTVQSNGRNRGCRSAAPRVEEGHVAVRITSLQRRRDAGWHLGNGGLVTFGFASGADTYTRTIAVDGSGPIVVAGESGSVLAVARLLPNGVFDTTFGSGEGDVLGHFPSFYLRDGH